MQTIAPACVDRRIVRRNERPASPTCPHSAHEPTSWSSPIGNAAHCLRDFMRHPPTDTAPLRKPRCEPRRHDAGVPRPEHIRDSDSVRVVRASDAPVAGCGYASVLEVPLHDRVHDPVPRPVPGHPHQTVVTIASRVSFHFGIHASHTLMGSGHMRKKILSRVIRSFRPQTEHERGETGSQLARDGSATERPIDLQEQHRHRDHDGCEPQEHTDSC